MGDSDIEEDHEGFVEVKAAQKGRGTGRENNIWLDCAHSEWGDVQLFDTYADAVNEVGDEMVTLRKPRLLTSKTTMPRTWQFDCMQDEKQKCGFGNQIAKL